MPVLMSLTQGLADLCGFHNCKEALTEYISLVTGVVMGEGFPVPVPSAGCRAVCSGVGSLPPSRSARSPVTQPSPRWPGARPLREGPPSQTQTACIAVSMFRGLFTVLNCRALLESPPRRGIKQNSKRSDNSLLNSWPRRVSVASGEG